jgi:hypothetical protein
VDIRLIGMLPVMASAFLDLPGTEIVSELVEHLLLRCKPTLDILPSVVPVVKGEEIFTFPLVLNIPWHLHCVSSLPAFLGLWRRQDRAALAATLFTQVQQQGTLSGSSHHKILRATNSTCSQITSV